MMGYMDPDRIRELYSEAAVVVLPSYSESFGMAIVEAMASGKAVVVSDQVGVASLISRRGAGLVVEPKASKIADALVRIMGCSEMASRLGEAARELCSTEFRWEQVVEQINGIYIATVRTPSPIL
jgi:glycosyltransferase involved in cell wall biosynthesis